MTPDISDVKDIYESIYIDLCSEDIDAPVDSEILSFINIFNIIRNRASGFILTSEDEKEHSTLFQSREYNSILNFIHIYNKFNDHDKECFKENVQDCLNAEKEYSTLEPDKEGVLDMKIDTYDNKMSDTIKEVAKRM